MNTLLGRIKRIATLAFLFAILFGVPAFAQCSGCGGCTDGGTAPSAGRSGGSIDTPG